MKKTFLGLITSVIIFAAFFIGVRPMAAQNIIENYHEKHLRSSAIQQIEALAREKKSRTSVERKIDSNLLYEIKMSRGSMIADGVSTLETGIKYDERGFVEVDIVADITEKLLKELEIADAKIIVSVPELRSITVSVPLSAVEKLAALSEVDFIMPRQKAVSNRATENQIAESRLTGFFNLFNSNTEPDFTRRSDNMQNFIKNHIGGNTDAGSVTSQADVTHQANAFRAATGVNGTGVKIGVLSDGVNTLAARQATGDLPPNVTIISGQAGNGDEGTAMLELVHDLAPGAQLYFATGFTSVTSFAQNVRALRAAGCTIIIDDVSYFSETAFQNGQAGNVVSNTNGGVVVQAVNDVTVGSMGGALFFSSAANSGNKNDGTAGTWEGDFVDAGPAGGILNGAGNLHSFGSTVINPVSGSTTAITLKWSDPLGGSANDYDLFLIDPSGTQVLASATNGQSGTQDPFESINSQQNLAGNSVVVTKFSGSSRFLHLNTNRGRLTTSTSGTTYGHNSGLNTISVAATPSGPARDGTNGTIGPFPNPHSSSNSVELFSSDGPRRIFYNADSSPITPGNTSATGGQLLAKPDLTAADGTSTTTPNFIPFFGTSAAAPHAGALFALVKSACPSATNTQLVNAFRTTAIDIEAPGPDRDSGVGIIMPIPARNALCSAPPTTTRKPFDFDGDGKSDISVFRPSNGGWYINGSQNGFTGLIFGLGTDLPAPADFDGDGKTDVAVFRNGNWYYLKSSDNSFVGVTFGQAGDLPRPADFDGDGRADINVFRPANGAWYRLNSTNNSFFGVAFGQNGDQPLVANFDGDNKADIAVFRPSTGSFYSLDSSNGAFRGTAFGFGTDIPTPGDFDGDGKTDVAVFRPSNGGWYRLNSMTGAFFGVAFGQNGDIPVTGDFDGDGRSDIAVFRTSNGAWYYLNSSNGGFVGLTFGAGTDKPIPSAFQ